MWMLFTYYNAARQENVPAKMEKRARREADAPEMRLLEHLVHHLDGQEEQDQHQEHAGQTDHGH